MLRRLECESVMGPRICSSRYAVFRVLSCSCIDLEIEERVVIRLRRRQILFVRQTDRVA